MASILYVEDEAEARDLIAGVLTQQYPGLTLHLAADGSEGLALFREHRPQVVITDIRMPVMDGLAMAKGIREIDAEVSLVALTAFSDTSFLVTAIELGFSHYVFKPINIKKLLWAIDRTLAVVDLKQQVKERNEQLQESEERLRATFDQAAVGIAHVNLDGTFLRINKRYCDIVGCSEEHPTLDMFTFTHPDDLPRCREHHQLVVGGKLRSYSLEKRYVNPDGTIVWAALTVSLVVNHPDFMVVILDDITDRKLLQAEIADLNEALAGRAAQLEEANRDLKAFNHTVAHDLRQPLNLISGYCQALQQFCGSNLDEECRDFLQKAYEGTLRMNRLVTVLLQFSEAAYRELKQERVDLTAAAEEVAAELKRTEPGRKVTFRIAAGMVAEGDDNLLGVVVANLLGNAWKYSSEREEALIEFDSTEVDGARAFFVRDNGSGFETTEAKEIFRPFRRLPSGQRVGGFGIGLGTVERIIKRHGGKVWAQGEPGKGATFYFTIPSASADSR
jgi:PAS domain S-box-containing protein